MPVAKSMSITQANVSFAQKPNSAASSNQLCAKKNSSQLQQQARQQSSIISLSKLVSYMPQDCSSSSSLASQQNSNSNLSIAAKQNYAHINAPSTVYRAQFSNPQQRSAAVCTTTHSSSLAQTNKLPSDSLCLHKNSQTSPNSLLQQKQYPQPPQTDLIYPCKRHQV